MCYCYSWYRWLWREKVYIYALMIIPIMQQSVYFHVRRLWLRHQLLFWRRWTSIPLNSMRAGYDCYSCRLSWKKFLPTFIWPLWKPFPLSTSFPRTLRMRTSSCSTSSLPRTLATLHSWSMRCRKRQLYSLEFVHTSPFRFGDKCPWGHPQNIPNFLSLFEFKLPWPP